MIRILLVDDQRLMREGVRILLDLEPDLEVVGEVADGRAAITAYAQLRPDVVLMDIRMPELDGVEATRRIVTDDPAARVIILTTFDDDEYVFEGVRAGALGYMLKAASGEELADAVRTVAAGGGLIEPSVARRVMAEFARISRPSQERVESLLEPLSDRELDILKLLALGLANREIADRLHLAEGTVKNYVSSVMQKLNVRDRTQAALRARELGLI
ncbi:MAG: response regulator transcription factor [Caldilineaceae bacterium]|nr:response regulator transcription factor [Caldilineaceae bacterium]